MTNGLTPLWARIRRQLWSLQSPTDGLQLENRFLVTRTVHGFFRKDQGIQVQDATSPAGQADLDAVHDIVPSPVGAWRPWLMLGHGSGYAPERSIPDSPPGRTCRYHIAGPLPRRQPASVPQDVPVNASYVRQSTISGPRFKAGGVPSGRKGRTTRKGHNWDGSGRCSCR